MSNDQQREPIRERSENEIQRQAERSSDPPVENEIEHQVQRGEAEPEEESVLPIKESD
jgi:hypothetical protein